MSHKCKKRFCMQMATILWVAVDTAHMLIHLTAVPCQNRCRNSISSENFRIF